MVNFEIERKPKFGTSLYLFILIFVTFFHSLSDEYSVSIPLSIITAIAFCFALPCYPAANLSFFRKVSPLKVSLKCFALLLYFLFSILLVSIFSGNPSERYKEVNFFQIFNLAVAEELIFRVFIPLCLVSWLKSQFAIPFSFIVSSLLYAVWHLPENTYGVLFYLFSGLIFSSIFTHVGFVWTSISHFVFNFITSFFSISYSDPWTSFLYFLLLSPILISPVSHVLDIRGKCVRAERKYWVDVLRGFSLCMILVDNLTLYSWGQPQWFQYYKYIHIFENIGYHMFLSLLGYSLISLYRKDKNELSDRYSIMLKIGLINVFLFSPFDIIVQMAFIALLLSKISFWVSRWGAMVSILSLAALVVSSVTAFQISEPVADFPRNIFVGGLEYYSLSLMNLFVQIITVPIYLGIPGILIYIKYNCFSIGGKGVLCVSILGFILSRIIMQIYNDATSLSLNTILSIYIPILLVDLADKTNIPEIYAVKFLSALGKSTLTCYILTGAIITFSPVIFNGDFYFLQMIILLFLSILISPALRMSDFSVESILRGRSATRAG